LAGAGGSIRDPADSGLEPGRVEEKTGERKKPGMNRLARPIDPARPRQKPGCHR